MYNIPLVTVLKNRKNRFKLLLILTIGFGIFMYITDLSSLWLLRFFRDGEHRKWKTIGDQENQSYFIDTEGCRMPSFKVFDENVEKFVFDVPPIECGKPLVRSNNNYLWIDLSETEIEKTYGVDDVNKLFCEYQPFRRKTDYENEFSKIRRVFRFGELIPVPNQFVRVICRLKGEKKEVYRDYHFLLKNKQANTIQRIRVENKTEKDEGNEPMSVMVIGIDSVSRLNFHRQMGESAAVLLNDLQAIEMFGFNKVADNTYPNLIPTLTGLDENELNSSCVSSENDTFDRCDFIWNTFKKKNFTTAYVEDAASLGLFHYYKAGFTNQPTDYSLRPAMVEMECNDKKPQDFNTYLCLGKRRTFDVLLEYAQKFITLMADRLHFSFFWSTSYTHDYLNFPTLIDANLAEFLLE
ncbi:uncharacterized protein LOC129580072, partial [Sitodiplosis mosellana]|uniref:uncharacterized protein LOC129580072 n=1 Tax=Sitodiplosis mosellana TaxID=263140 RepID=UPI002444BD13